MFQQNIFPIEIIKIIFPTYKNHQQRREIKLILHVCFQLFLEIKEEN